MSQEVMYGCAGYLFALLFTRKYLPESIDNKLICRVAAHIVALGREEAKSCSGATLLYTWHDKQYLGAAHGLAGILYTLLQADCLTPNEIEANVVPAVNYLLSQRHPSCNLRSSLSSQLDQLVQWCHGAPGLVPLLTALHHHAPHASFLQEAVRCATPVWQRGLLRKGHGLCHGTLGNAYTFLDLFQTTEDPTWLSKAVHFAEWSLGQRDVAKKYDKEMKLFDGLAGLIYFYCEMLEPKSAAFPGFQVPK
jgi:lantibiotic modifying enzyme